MAFVEEALEIAPARAELWLELAELEAWRGRRDQSEDAFARAFALLEGGEPLALARARLRHARANHGPICFPRVARESARTALELIERAGVEASEERSEALAACAWCEAVAGSAEEAERLLERLSAEPDASGDWRVYDIAHARALVLMRRGRFTESYGPSIAAGAASDRIGRPDLAYGAWVNAAGAATAAGEYERALEFLDRGMAAVPGHALKGIEADVLAAKAFVLRSLGRLEDARRAAEAEQAVAEQLGQPDLLAKASHDRGLVALEQGAMGPRRAVASRFAGRRSADQPAGDADRVGRGARSWRAPGAGGVAASGGGARAGPSERLPRDARAAAGPRPGAHRTRARKR